MFMILAPRATPTGPPKFTLHREKDQKADVVAEATKTEEPTSA